MRGKVLQTILSLSATALLLYVLLSGEGLAEFTRVWAQVDRGAVACYAAAALVGLLVRALRYGTLLRPCCLLPLPALVVLTAIRNALVDLLPARLGELSVFYVFKRYGVRLADALAVFALCQILDLVVLAAFISIGILLAILLPSDGGALAAFAPQAGKGTALIGLAAAALCAGGSAVVLRSFERIIRRAAEIFARGAERYGALRPFGFASTVLDGAADSAGLVRSLGLFPRAITLTVLIRLLKYGSLYFLLLGVMLPLGVGPVQFPPLTALVAFVVAEASASLPFSGIMGFGAYEGAFSAVLALFQVKIPSTLSVILAVHVISQIVGYSIGILGMLAFAAAHPPLIRPCSWKRRMTSGG